MRKHLITITLGAMLSFSMVVHAERTYIQIVGSSTVYPFATVVAERFGKTSDFRTPIIEATGSGGGMKLFCSGTGPGTPDFTNSSRRIKMSEFDQCQANGVIDVIEVKIGYDGIVLANSQGADQFDLTRQDIFLALAKNVPNPDGTESTVSNPYISWQDVNPELPGTKIEVLGPPPTSGTRDAFVELAMEGGCNAIDWIKSLKSTSKDDYKDICHTVREDGAFIEAGENDNLIVQKLQENSKALGIFGFSFLDQNEDIVQGSMIDGVEPEFEAIAEGDYPVSRPLYIYGKKAHVGVIPGMHEFMTEFTSDAAVGEEGYLTDKGLIPMPEEEREQFADAIKNLTPLTLK